MRFRQFFSACFGAVFFTGNVLITVAGAQRAAVPDDIAAGYKQITETDLKANLTFLASDALQGRMSLEPGDDAAAQWIASEFAKDGLEPAAAGSYLQPVPLLEYRPDRAQSYVALKRATAGKQWKFPDAYGAFPRDVDVTANVMFAGFGITAPELKYDDYTGIDAHCKIVLIFDHEPQETGSAFYLQWHRQHAVCHNTRKGIERTEARSHRRAHRSGAESKASLKPGTSGSHRGHNGARHTAAIASFGP